MIPLWILHYYISVAVVQQLMCRRIRVLGTRQYQTIENLTGGCWVISNVTNTGCSLLVYLLFHYLYWSKLWSNALKIIVLALVGHSHAKSNLQDYFLTSSSLKSIWYTLTIIWYDHRRIPDCTERKLDNFGDRVVQFFTLYNQDFWRANFWLVEADCTAFCFTS